MSQTLAPASHPIRSRPPLIPSAPGSGASYWCTWGSQNYAVDDRTFQHVIALGDHSVPADNLTEDALFGESGWATSAFAPVRADLYVMMDVGWDVPLGASLATHPNMLGSLIVADDKFPSCTGTPAERLAKLNDLCRSAGWRGAGIWVAAHPASAIFGQDTSDTAALQAYYDERLRWSHEAGIGYWKVDYGHLGGDVAFRRMLTERGRELAPHLVIEHARCGAPANDEECPWDSEDFGRTGSFRAWDGGKPLQRTLDLLAFSDVLRSYDVLTHLSIPITLDRVAQCLVDCGERGFGGWINCEDEPVIGAVLGCTIGIMRHPACRTVEGSDYDPDQVRLRQDEIVRALHWQRIAPPWRSGETPTTVSDESLADHWTFAPGDTWAKWVHHHEIMQRAPARVGRNLPLPVVDCDGPPPYVLASRNPNGAIAVGTLPRRGLPLCRPDVSLVLPPTDVQLIGVFGHFDSLTLVCPEGDRPTAIFGQDLAKGQPTDITAQCEWTFDRLVIPGHLLETLGTSAATPGDLSDPGAVLRLEW